jgi:hypothetical protein
VSILTIYMGKWNGFRKCNRLPYLLKHNFWW